MTNKTILIGLIAIAFVAGSITTGTMASAQKGGVGDNLIVDALNNIAAAINGINPNVQVDVPPAEVQVIGVEGPPGPQGEKGDKGEQGDTGEQGPPGAIITYVMESSETVEPQTIKTITGFCNSGDKSINIGYSLSSTELMVKTIGHNAPNDFLIQVVNTGNAIQTARVFADCIIQIP